MLKTNSKGKKSNVGFRRATSCNQQELIYYQNFVVNSLIPSLLPVLLLNRLLSSLQYPLFNHSFIHSFIQQLMKSIPNLRKGYGGLPWWSNGRESACQCRVQGFDPQSRKIPHPPGQLSLCVTTTEAHAPQSPCFTREATAMRSPPTTTREQPPLPATRESLHTATKTQSSPKNK